MAIKPVLGTLLGRRVDIYLNLHKPGFLSVRSASGMDRGLVIAHVQGIEIADCEFKVSEKGRDRVRRLKRKEVHAVVRGTIKAIFDGNDAALRTSRLASEGGRPVRYNPYETDYFQTRDTQQRIDKAEHVVAHGGWLVAA